MVALLSLALLGTGVWAFAADAGNGPSVLLDVLDKRASVVSMVIGVLGLLIAAMALWAQLSTSSPGSGIGADGGQVPARPGSAPISDMPGGTAAGQVTGPARLSGPVSAEGEHAIAIGQAGPGLVMGSPGAIAVSGPVSGGVSGPTQARAPRSVSVGGDLAGVVFTGDLLSSRRSLPDVSRVSAPRGVLGLPRPAVATFVGREDVLAQLHQALMSGTGTQVISQAVVGLGGVGKSELALQYARRYGDSYQLVGWIQADSAAQIQAGLAQLTRALVAGIDSAAAEQATSQEAAAWALAWLGTHTGWLMIFDNVEDVADIEPHLGRLGPGQVLITSRRDIGWEHLDITPLRLRLMDRPASTALLTSLLQPPAAQQEALLDELAAQLGDLPLALRQAGAYITRTPRMTVRRYLHLLTEAPTRMHAAVPAGGDSERVVATVWALTHQRISQVNPLAGHLLNLLACYAPDNLPCAVLDGLPAIASGAGADEVAIGEALALLRSYSLITITITNGGDGGDGETGEPDELISVHRLVQATTLAQLTGEQRDALRDRAAALLHLALPSDPERLPTWHVYRLLLPHARAVLPFDSPALAQVQDYLEASGDYITALDVQRHIHAHTLNTLGADHLDTLTARHNLAHYTGLTGSSAAARDQFAALLPVRERVQSAEHPHVLTARHNLAHYTGLTGNAAAARDQLATLVPIQERVLGAEHPDSLTVRADLARWMGEAGDPAGARDRFAALLPVRERVLGAEHPDTLSTRHNLARWTGQAGDPAAACDQLAALLPVRERVLGAEHPATLATLHHLAHWRGETGETAAARDQLAALLPVRERVLGAEHPANLATRANLAFWIGDAGDATAARDQYTALLPVRERVLGAEHPNTLDTRANVASWTGEAGDPAAARNQLAALLPAEERVRGAEHPDTLITRHELALWTGKAGDAAAARDQLAALLPIHERVLGLEHADTLTTRHNLARWTGEAGDAAAARDQFAALLPADERVRGAEHPDTLITWHELALWTGQAGDPAAARDQLTILLPIFANVLGDEHPDTVRARANLAHYTEQAQAPRKQNEAAT
ncbi:tetratricopeptide repeat protein [Nonomuraea rhizosphaerae]|uniref:tetratricopeptide repeat protein n=1 Tax=Nonomuraea rhizosphaerae TaxID=2665663 RepID=UPI001C5EF02D|nr:tetratricopeptide repeat protein [Nonomuraea rhizosphaerae]